MEKDISGNYSVNLDGNAGKLNLEVATLLSCSNCFSAFILHPTLEFIASKKNGHW